MTTHLRVFADYHQLHLLDQGSTTDPSSAWTPDAARDKIVAAGDLVIVGTTVNVDVSVTVRMTDQAPAPAFELHDYVAEASIFIPSGWLLIMGCTDFAPEAPRFSVPKRWLRVRISRSNLRIAEELAEMSDEDPSTIEQVVINIWPAPRARTTVLKQPEWH